VEATGPTYHQQGCDERMSTDTERHPVICLVVAAAMTHPTFVPNTASHTHLTWTPAITVAKTPNNLIFKIHSICIIEKTSPPLLISIMAEKTGLYAALFGELGKLSCICQLPWNSTTPNHQNIKSYSTWWGSDWKPLLVQHRATRSGSYHVWSLCMNYTPEYIESQITNWWQCN